MTIVHFHGSKTNRVLSDKRSYQRLQVNASAFIRNPPPSMIGPLIASVDFGNIGFGWANIVTNISWRGAAIRGTGLLGEVGKRVELVLPAMNGEGITLLSRIIWKRQRDNGYESGVRFSHASPEDEAQFLTVLRILLTRPDSVQSQI